MSEIKGYLNNIPRFYQFQTFDHIMFGFIVGAMQADPKIGVSKALQMFLDKFDLCEDKYCFEAAKTTYYRILKRLAEKEYGFDPEVMDYFEKVEKGKI